MEATSLVKCNSLNEIFEALKAKIDIETGKDKLLEEQHEALLDYQQAIKSSSIESQLLLRLFLDSRPNIKKQAYLELLAQICNL